jgi:hypothetical protein
MKLPVPSDAHILAWLERDDVFCWHEHLTTSAKVVSLAGTGLA